MRKTAGGTTIVVFPYQSELRQRLFSHKHKPHVVLNGKCVEVKVIQVETADSLIVVEYRELFKTSQENA